MTAKVNPSTKIREENDALVREYFNPAVPYKEISSLINAKTGKKISAETIAISCKRQGLVPKKGHTPITGRQKNIPQELDPVVFSTTFTRYTKPVKEILATSVQDLSDPHPKFLENLKLYIKDQHIDTIFIFGMFGETANFGSKPVVKSKIVDELKKVCRVEVVDSNLIINQNVALVNAYQYPQQLNPLLGLERFVYKQGLTIVGGTKIGKKSVATRTETARMLISTGALSKPNYRNNRLGNIAKEMHQYGFARVSITDNTYFAHPRTVEVLNDGAIYDLDKKYSKGTVENTRVWGCASPDIHASSASPYQLGLFKKFIKHIKPQNVFLHDLSDNQSISHHGGNNQYTQWQNAKNGLTFVNECKITFKLLLGFIKDNPMTKFYVVRSNHDAWIERWVENIRESFFRTNPSDFYFLTKLFTVKCEKKPEVLLEEMYKLMVKDLTKNVPTAKQLVFLKDRDIIKYKNIEHAVHGDTAVNGSRGSIQSFSRLGVKINIGHLHNGDVLGGIYGTGVLLDKMSDGYHKNNGYSSWTNVVVLTHENGSRQSVTLWEKRSV